MAIKRGTTDVTAFFRGTQPVSAVYLGTTLVWSTGTVVLPGDAVVEEDLFTAVLEEDGAAEVEEGSGSGAGDVLEAVDLAAAQVTIQVDSGARHSFDGFGWSLDYNTARDTAMESLITANAAKLFANLNTKWLGAYTPGNAAAFRDQMAIGAANGVTGFICHGNLNRAAISTASFAALVKADWDAGLQWTHLCKQNEPDGNALNVYAADPDMTTKTSTLRAELNNRGLSAVKLIGDGWAHGGSAGNNEYDKHLAAGLIGASGLTAGAFHAYGDCNTPSTFDNPSGTARWWQPGTLGTGGLFQLEHGGNDYPKSLAVYFSALNNGVSVFLNFEGISKSAGFQHNLVDSTGALATHYPATQSVNQRLTVGSRFRLCHSSDTGTAANPLPDTAPEFRASRMVRASNSNPRVQTICAKRPDTKWVVAAVNNTFGTDDFTSLGGAHYGAVTEQLTWTIAELSGVSGTFTGKRHTMAGAVSDVSYPLINGQVRFTLPPGDTIVMVST